MLFFLGRFYEKVQFSPYRQKTRIFIPFICLIFIGFIFTQICHAGDGEDFQSAKNLFDRFDEGARPAIRSFMNRYPDSPYYSNALALDIICDFRENNYEKFNERWTEFTNKYTNHSLKYLLDYYKGLTLRRQKKWDEARAFFQEYLVKYPDSPHRKYAEEVTGNSQIELSLALDIYYKKDYEKARLLLSDFASSYPTHSRIDEILYRKADCLYQLKQNDEFMSESKALINENPRRKYAYMLLYLQSAVFVKQQKGAQAREILDLLENQYRSSDFYKSEDLNQMRLESYLYGENWRTAAALPNEWEKIERLLVLCTEQSVLSAKNLRMEKNINMANKYFSLIPDGSRKRLDFFRSLINNTNLKTDQSALIASQMIASLGENGLYEESENLAKIFFENSSQSSNKDKDSVLNSLVKIFIKKDGADKGAEIARKYQTYFQ